MGCALAMSYQMLHPSQCSACLYKSRPTRKYTGHNECSHPGLTCGKYPVRRSRGTNRGMCVSCARTGTCCKCPMCLHTCISDIGRYRARASTWLFFMYFRNLQTSTIECYLSFSISMGEHTGNSNLDPILFFVYHKIFILCKGILFSYTRENNNKSDFKIRKMEDEAKQEAKCRENVAHVVLGYESNETCHSAFQASEYKILKTSSLQIDNILFVYFKYSNCL